MIGERIHENALRYLVPVRSRLEAIRTWSA